MELRMNSYQTQLTDELKNALPKEVWSDLMEYIATVAMIKNLIAHQDVRGYARDRPRMKNDPSKIVVDITNPHILEDLDFFRERALFFIKNGKYTNLPVNGNPKSEYAAFWKEEVRRWKEGLVRESDGEWIPGKLYFYWNYSPIWLTDDKEKMPTVEEWLENLKKFEDEGSSKSEGERIQTFPNPWLGDYLFYHYIQQARSNGQHGKLLKTRGVGFSLKMGAISPCNMYTLPGSGNPNFHLASDKTFLTGDKGVFGKVIDVLDWIAKHTPLPKLRLLDSKRAMEIQLGYLDEYGVRQGLLSSVFGISLKDNPDKARGIRGPLIHYEEDGLFPNLEKAWGVNRKAVEDGNVAFGFMLAGGTGGTEGASFEGSEKLFYRTDAYNIYGIKNVFDKNVNGETKCGFFWGAYLNRHRCYDIPTGEPDVIKALVEILMDRFKVKYSSSDPSAITQKKAEEPITPQEAVMRTEGIVFPVADLKEYLETIAPRRESFIAEHYVGELVYQPDGSIGWKPNLDIHPLRSYNTVTGDRTGALEIFEMPRKNNNGQIPAGRYIGGIDPIDADAGKSLFSILIMDTFTDRIVAEYSGRPRTSKEAYEMAYKILKFYNAQANYENNLKGLFAYFSNKNALHYLADTPQILKDMELIKNIGYGNSSKGCFANARINSWGRMLQADWMLSKAYTNDEDDERLNLHRLRSIPYIEEAIYWNADGNFDRISAGVMLFILREDRFRRTQSAKNNLDKHVNKIANDPYFTRNFNKKDGYGMIERNLRRKFYFE
jgi:hypothetical protein